MINEKSATHHLCAREVKQVFCVLDHIISHESKHVQVLLFFNLDDGSLEMNCANPLGAEMDSPNHLLNI